MKIKYKIKYKIISVLAIIITVINISNISKANLIGKEIEVSAGWYGDIPYSYNNEERKALTRATNDNIPVYVMKKNNGSTLFTTSDFTFYNNEEIKNILKNGYGCKTYEELGVLNIVEAYLATQEAIYITLEGRNIEDYVIVTEEERAKRILNATKEILENASKENLDEIDISSNYASWKTYEKDSNYKYKEYTIKSGNNVTGDIKIIEGEDIRIVDKNTNEIKQGFNTGDEFYLIVPKNLDQRVNIQFNFKVHSAYLYTYKKTDALEEQYILAEPADIDLEYNYIEDIITEVKLEIVNKDQETKTAITGNEFSIINEDGTILQQNLVTNEEGKIHTTLTKGKYYLKQTSVIEGYNLNKALIEIDVNNEENININIENTKPIIEETTTVNKEINVVEEHKNVVENNITQVSNITTTNINKEIINETNETNLHNVNNFINTINKKYVTNLTKENTYNNYIDELITNDKTLEGENVTLNMTRQDYVNYIDLIMIDTARVPILPVASK